MVNGRLDENEAERRCRGMQMMGSRAGDEVGGRRMIGSDEISKRPDITNQKELTRMNASARA